MKKIVFVLVFYFVTVNLFAQKTIVSIGDTNISKEQYEQIYTKNNTQLFDETQKKSPTEYMDLFIDYKLKVLEAESMGMDTLPEFIEELKGYRDELAQQYLTDISISDEMLREAYFRSIHEIKASHILINLAPDASPGDTLEAYHRAIKIRNKFLNQEESFEDLAVTYSDDPSAQRNQGNLGYFKAFNMIVDFENAAYNTPVGEVSMPIRTDFGYHLIYVTDLYKSEGDVRVAHIMKMFDSNQATDLTYLNQLENEIDSIYNALNNGASWNEMVMKHSDDVNSAQRNGDMNWISKTFTVPEFVDAAFALENKGDISQPVRTTFGWHIIKLLDKREPLSFDEMKDDLSLRLRRDPHRSHHNKQKFIAKLKSELEYKVHTNNFSKLTEYIEKQNNQIQMPLPDNILNLVLYSVNEKEFSTNSFIKMNNFDNQNNIAKSIFSEKLEEFEDEVFIMYQDLILEEENPEFAQTMQEYRDGMLLFAIMQEKVWDKAVNDSTGLEKFYESKEDKYVWGKHFDGLLIHAFNEQALEKSKNIIARGITNPDSIMAVINTDKTNIRVAKGKWEKGDNEKIDHLVFDGPEPKHISTNFEFVHGEIKDAGIPKSLDEARGYYISDYQKVLEDEWMKELRAKYKIKINQRQLRKIKSL